MLRCSRWLAGALLAGGLALFAGPAHATVVQALSLREKTEKAPVIVHAVVRQMSVAWSDDHARIRTHLDVEVLECLRGAFEPGAVLPVHRGGGRIGQTWQWAPGLAEYAVGDEVVLFLEPLGAEFVSIGIGIGTYRVEQKDLGRGLEPVVQHRPDVAGVRYQSGAPVQPRPEAVAPMRPEPLALFLKRVRSFALGRDDRPVVLPRKQPVFVRPAPRVLEVPR